MCCVKRRGVNRRFAIEDANASEPAPPPTTPGRISSVAGAYSLRPERAIPNAGLQRRLKACNRRETWCAHRPRPLKGVCVQGPGAGLKLDEAGDNQNCAPEAGAQQYSGNCPTRAAVMAHGRFRKPRTIVAERESGIFPDV